MAPPRSSHSGSTGKPARPVPRPARDRLDGLGCRRHLPVPCPGRSITRIVSDQQVSRLQPVPPLYQSKPMRPLPAAAVLRGELQPGDSIVIATDATGQELLSEVEVGNRP